MTIISISLIALFFSACGDDAHFKNETIQIDVIRCDTANAVIPDDYISMYTGDVLVSETDDTVVTTYHDINEIKKICVDSGSAYLERVVVEGQNNEENI